MPEFKLPHASPCLSYRSLPFSALLLLGGTDGLLCISIWAHLPRGRSQWKALPPASWSILPLLFSSSQQLRGPLPGEGRLQSHLSFLLRPQAEGQAGMWHAGNSCPMYQALSSQNSLSAARPYLYLLDTHKCLSNGLQPCRLSARWKRLCFQYLRNWIAAIFNIHASGFEGSS